MGPSQWRPLTYKVYCIALILLRVVTPSIKQSELHWDRMNSIGFRFAYINLYLWVSYNRNRSKIQWQNVEGGH